jgi:hypothetical protein
MRIIDLNMRITGIITANILRITHIAFVKRLVSAQNMRFYRAFSILRLSICIFMYSIRLFRNAHINIRKPNIDIGKIKRHNTEELY